MWTFLFASLAFVIARLVVRIRSFSKLFVDDYLIIAAWFMFLASAIVWKIKAHTMFELYALQRGEIPFTTDFLNAYATFLPHIVTFNTLFYTCIWSVKASFLVFFYRLGAVIEHRWWWWTVVVLTFCGWVACIADIDYQCSVSDITWIFMNCSLAPRVKFDSVTFYANMAADVFTDLLIISIPFLILWNVRIPSKKKLLLFGLFSVTVLIIAISLVRVILVKGYLQNQLQEASIDWLYLWSNLEMGIGGFPWA